MKSKKFRFSLRLALFALLFGFSSAIAAESPSVEPPRVLILAIQPHAGEEGPESAMLVVLRIGSSERPLDVRYAIGGTAVNVVDYQPLHGVVTIPAGAWFAPIVVTPVDDAIEEERETVVVELAAAGESNGAQSYGVAWPGRAVVAIADNDSAVNHPPNVSLLSPPDGAVFRGPLDLRLAARAFDADGRVVHVEFFAGDASLGVALNDPAIVVLPIQDLEDLELPERLPSLAAEGVGLTGSTLFDIIPHAAFQLVWHDAPPGRHVLRAVATDNDGAITASESATIEIAEDNHQPIVTVVARDPIAAEGDSATDEINTATFVVHRTGDTDFPMDVFFRFDGSAMNGVDFRETPNKVTIAVGERTASVTIAPIDDAEVEGRENVILQVEPPVCVEIVPPPADCYVVGRSGRAEAHIRDNDEPNVNHPPSVQIVRPLDHSAHAAGGDIMIVAQSRDLDGSVASVEFFAGDRSLGVVTGLSRSAGLVDVSSILPPFHLTWADVAPGAYALRAEATDNKGGKTLSRPVEIRVVERIIPPVVSIVATDGEAAEPTSPPDGSRPPTVLNTATFRVHRTGPTDAEQKVYYRLSGSAKNGEDYSELSGEVTIPPGSAVAEIVIAPIDDHLVEGRETVLATLVRPAVIAIFPPPPGDYIVGEHSRARAVIADNDSDSENVAPHVELAGPANGTRFRAGSSVRIVADARDRDGHVVAVEFFANGDSLGVVRNGDMNLVGTAGLNDRRVASENSFSRDHLFQFVWAHVPAGEFRLTAIATDDDGVSTTSGGREIRVLAEDQQVVSVHARDPRAREGGTVIAGGAFASDVDTATFVLSRRGNLEIALPVFYAVGGSAENGVDYLRLSGEAVIPAGQESVALTIVPFDDDAVERLESIVLEVRHPNCPAIFPAPPTCYVVGQPGRAAAHIQDNDSDRNHAPKVTIASPRRESKFAAPAEIEIVAHARDSDGWVTQVEFFAGDGKIGESVVHFFDAPESGLRQVFALTWPDVAAGSYLLRVRATDNLGASSMSEPIEVLVREANARPVVSIVARDSHASEAPLASGGLNSAVLAISRVGSTETSLSVSYVVGGTAENGADYQSLSGTAVIPAGERLIAIEVVPVDDSLVERRETVTLSLSFPGSLSPGQDSVGEAPAASPYEIGHRRRAGAVIFDNDRPADPNDGLATARRLDDGVMLMTLTGPEGMEGLIEASENLVDWFPVGNAVVVGGVIHIVDAEAGAKTFQFYRVVSSDEKIEQARNF